MWRCVIAKNVKTGGRDWKKGQSGNPAGRPALPPEVRELRKLTQAEFDRIANDLLSLTEVELKERLLKPELTVLEKMIGNAVGRAAFSGDYKCLDALLNRIVGRPRQQTPAPEDKPIASFVDLVKAAEAKKKHG